MTEAGSSYLNAPKRTEEQARRGLQPMASRTHALAYRYGKWTIYYEPPPIPDRRQDWQFVHDDYDGCGQHAYDPPSDPRCGAAESVDACMDEIDEIAEGVAEAAADAINAALREGGEGNG